MIIHMPPPIHGAAVIGKSIFESTLLNSNFKLKFVNLSFSERLSDIGKFKVSKLRYFLKLLLSIYTALRKSKYQFAYLSLNAKGPGLWKDCLFVLIVKFFRLPVLYHFHNKGIRSMQDRIVDDYLYKFVFKRCKVILLSGSLKEDIIKYVSDERIYICPNGIDKTRIVTKKEYLGSTIISFLFLSNMMKEKGVFDLLLALAELKIRKYSFTCNFVGGWFDIDEETFRQKVNELDLHDYVYAFGPQFGMAKEKFLAEADVFILPSHNECFPLVVLEAMKYGLPVIATNEGGIPDIVDEGVTGVLVNVKSNTDLTEKMEYFIKKPEQIKIMGDAGYVKFMKNYTLEIFESKLAGIFTDMLQFK